MSSPVRHDVDGSMVIPGGFPVHDLDDIGVEDSPEGSYATVAGLVLDRLGRLPDDPGDRVTVGDWLLTVTSPSTASVAWFSGSRRTRSSLRRVRRRSSITRWWASMNTHDRNAASSPTNRSMPRTKCSSTSPVRSSGSWTPWAAKYPRTPPATDT